MTIILAVNTWKTKNTSSVVHGSRMSSRHDGKHVTVGSNPFEKVKTFKYLGSLLKNRNSIHGEIKRRL